MDLVDIPFKALRFPGAAGEHQRAGATASLIRELGDNYPGYHEFLRKQLAAIGKRPDPSDYATMQEYLAAWTRIEEIVKAEALLRTCYFHRQRGHSLKRPLDPAAPMIDSDDRLVALE